MKPAPFRYLAPGSQDEVLDMLGLHGADAKLLAGGQSLVPLLNFRVARPGAIIDLNRVPGLDGVRLDAEMSELVFGAMVRQSDAERAAAVRDACPILAEALSHVGHRAIRNRGTIGGSLAHADPAAELPLLLVLLDGRVCAGSARGERWLPAADFFVSYLTTALEPIEMLTEARFQVPRPKPLAVSGWGFQEFSRRAGDFALAAAAVQLRIDDAGMIIEAALAIAGGGPTPVRAARAEQALIGNLPSGRLFAQVASLAAATCETAGDIHASAGYRRELIGVLIERALAQACADHLPAEPGPSAGL